MPSQDITAKYLHEQMRYDPETGELWWRVQKHRRKMDQPAGSVAVNGRYRQISINRRQYLAHRLAWLYVHGEWPNGQIDHINGDRLDNRIANLREADNAQNSQNRPQQSNNKSGFKGVFFNHRHSQPWQAQIMARGQRVQLGYFATAEEAHEAYKEAAARLHGEFARTE